MRNKHIKKSQSLDETMTNATHSVGDLQDATNDRKRKQTEKEVQTSKEVWIESDILLPDCIKNNGNSIYFLHIFQISHHEANEDDISKHPTVECKHYGQKMAIESHPRHQREKRSHFKRKILGRPKTGQKGRPHKLNLKRHRPFIAMKPNLVQENQKLASENERLRKQLQELESVKKRLDILERQQKELTKTRI